MPQYPDEFLVAAGTPVLHTAGWTDESTLKLGLMGVGARISVDA